MRIGKEAGRGCTLAIEDLAGDNLAEAVLLAYDEEQDSDFGDTARRLGFGAAMTEEVQPDATYQVWTFLDGSAIRSRDTLVD